MTEHRATWAKIGFGEVVEHLPGKESNRYAICDGYVNYDGCR
jgi:hypothetical protein